MSSPPTGTVTFLFTDIEGSTKLAQANPAAWEAARLRHHSILNEAVAMQHGYVFQIVGDAFCAAFANASDAAAAAVAAQRALATENWGQSPLRVRMGVHTGTAVAIDGEYDGYLTLAHAQRIMSAAHGGQVLVSSSSAQLLKGDAATRDAASIQLRDLGEVRLKDFSTADHIYQLAAPDLPSDFLPLQSLSGVPNNLPVQLTSFIGRERELNELCGLMPATRLLTLTGSGGVGKTRLSLQLASASFEMFKGGLWFVELAPVLDPVLVPQAIAAAIGLREQTGQSLMSLLCDYLRPRTALLIVDNCEHLILETAKVVDILLRSAPDLKIIASSREALGVPGELAWRVPSLEIPPARGQGEADGIGRYEAVRLFIERARFAQAAFELTADNSPAVLQICRRLDGIPLALELAAARVRAMPVETIATRLDDAFRILTGGSRTALPRQQTLRAAIDWSHQLLPDDERVLLRRLAVFSGGWSLEAAETVCTGNGLASEEVLDLLARLVEKSLVFLDESTTGQARYHLLETVRQYAREKLFESGEGERTRAQHLAHFVQLAETAAPHLRGSQQLHWAEQLDIENDNVRAALEWSLAAARIEEGLRLVSALAWFWDMRGYIAEGREHVEAFLAHPGAAPRTMLRARALLTASINTFWYDELFHQRLGEAVSIAREHPSEGKDVLPIGLWELAAYENDPVKAQALRDESLAIVRELGDKWTLAWLKNLESYQLNGQRQFAASRDSIEQSLSLFRAVGDERLATMMWGNLGRALLREGNVEAARTHFAQSLVVFQQIGDRRNAAINQNYLGEIARYEGNDEEAKRYYGAALSLARDIGLSRLEASILSNLGFALLHTGDLAEARIRFEEAMRLGNRLEIKYFLALKGIATLWAVQHRSAPGVRLFAAAEAIDASFGILNSQSSDPADDAEDRRSLALFHSQLDDAAFDAEWAIGLTMTADQAIAYARGHAA